MDRIILKRTVIGEFAPQYWILTGGEFGEMLSAVKALPFRQYDERERVWAVKYDGIQKLREGGLTVSRNPDVRVLVLDQHHDIQKLENGADVQVTLDYRVPGNRENWGVIPEARPHFAILLHFDFEPAQIEEIAAQVATDEIVQKTISEKNRPSFCHDSAILTLVMRQVEKLSAQAQECYKEHRGKRSLDEHHAAVEAAWKAVSGH